MKTSDGNVVRTGGGLILMGIAVLAAVAPAMAQRPLGIDVSYWQGDLSQTTWNNVRSANRTFAFIRCVHYGVSGGDPDPYFASNMTRARTAGILAGAYHFARPTTRDPITEADYFVYYATQYWTGWTQYGPNFISSGFLRPVLDLEEGGGTTPVGAANLSAWANAWLDRVQQQTGVEPMVYCNSNYAKNYLNSTLASRTLWIANYSCSVDPQTGSPPSGIGIWSTWKFWQYCSSLSVAGISPVDTDVFNGTAAQLQTYVIGGGSVPPTISGVQATNVTNSAATITWTTDTPSSSQVQYGLTTSYGSSSALDSTAVTAHSVTISGLSPNTLYHYRAISTNGYGTTNSTDYTFTTSGPPTISSVQAGGITGVSATITWTTNAPATSQVNYGLSAGYGSQTALDSTLVTSHSVVISGLQPTTTYHCQALSTNSYGSAQSTDLTFTTVVSVPDIIVDNTDTNCQVTGTWTTGTASTHIGTDYIWISGVTGTGEASATGKIRWTPSISAAGNYDVYVYYASGTNRSTNTYWKVTNSGSPITLRVNEQTPGNAWTLLTSNVPFLVGTNGYVELMNNTGDTAVVQGDAVKLVFKNAIAQPPTIVQHPAAQSVCAGSTATFTVAATGEGTLTYQWQKGGVNVSNGGHYAGATTTTLTVSGADTGDVANYACIVTNSVGSTPSNSAALTIKAATSITQHPTAQSVCAGGTATFTVAGSGDGTLTYQWQKNSGNLSNGGHYAGATTATLTVSGADAGDVANYSCVVTAGCGNATSSQAALSLKTATAITQQPVAQTVNAGSTATFTVAAGGDGSLTYQWQKDSANLTNGGHYSGVTTTTLLVSAADAADAGSYRCVVTAGCGTATSNAVALTVKMPTYIAADFDHDGDVDLSDFSFIQMCFNGPNKPPAQSNCAPADLDGDGDVDLTDFSLFQACFNGPSNPPACK